MTAGPRAGHVLLIRFGPQSTILFPVSGVAEIFRCNSKKERAEHAIAPVIGARLKERQVKWRFFHAVFVDICKPTCFAARETSSILSLLAAARSSPAPFLAAINGLLPTISPRSGSPGLDRVCMHSLY